MNRFKNFLLPILIPIFLTIFSLFPAGCTKSSTPSEPKQEVKDNTEKPSTPAPENEESEMQASELFPVNDGWSWEYQGEGNEYASFKREVVYTEGNLAQLREDNGGTVTASVFQISPDQVTRIFFTGEAYEEKNYLNTTPGEKLILIKSPVKVGTKWNTTSAGTREIVDTKATVTTPAGNFTDCVKIKINEENATSYEYYKSGTGLVLREFITEDTKVTSTLEKFNTAKIKQ